MECNRDEALRAKTIAEGKLEKKDFAGARKFVLKAKALYPALEGISQMLTTLDVYVAAENRIGGEIDWYGVLGVTPNDDVETIRKQYRKLALVLHPDKNKSVGADGAFTLISEAWSLLSDRAKRLVYNQKRSLKGFQHKGQTQSGGPSAAPSRDNGIFNFATKMTSFPRAQKNGANVPHAQIPPSNQRSDTFWTICHRCKMHYEYHRKYLNHTLLCTTCHEGFMASETAPPSLFYQSSNQVPQQRPEASNDQVPTRDVPVSKKSGPGSNSVRHPNSRSSSVGSTNPSVAGRAANVVQQAQDRLKRKYIESHSSAGVEGSVKKRKVDDDTSHLGINGNAPQGNSGIGPPGSRIHGFAGTSHKPNSTRELNPVEARKLLIAKAKNEIQAYLSTMRTETTKASDKEDVNKGCNQNGKTDSNVAAVKPRKNRISNSVDKDPAAVAMTVPDPDFYDFDQDRSESSFEDNEVWAGYDDDDGMPRFYALISKVLSRRPFKLRISWLNSKTNAEFSDMDWVDSGFYKTCGEFRVGRYENCKSINAFSQKVKWSKGPRGSILIFPQKDDVWALYKNWSSEWSEQTPDEVIHKYDMVTVLDEYNEDQGIRVAPLVKISGFKSVFRPNMDPELIQRIPKEEMLRFSHRVPYHQLNGQEAPNAPAGCFELDPAATPLDLLEVITENKDADVPAVSNQTTPNVAEENE